MIADLAKNVAVAINNSGLLPEGVEAVSRTLPPIYERIHLKEMKVVVVPVGKGAEAYTRSNVKVDHEFDVGFYVSVSRGAEQENQVGDYIAMTEQIAIMMFGEVIDGHTCIKVEHTALYSDEHLRKKSIFFGVLTLGYKGIT